MNNIPTFAKWRAEPVNGHTDPAGVDAYHYTDDAPPVESGCHRGIVDALRARVAELEAKAAIADSVPWGAIATIRELAKEVEDWTDEECDANSEVVDFLAKGGIAIDPFAALLRDANTPQGDAA